jgi:hypothetical protein
MIKYTLFPTATFIFTTIILSAYAQNETQHTVNLSSFLTGIDNVKNETNSNEEKATSPDNQIMTSQMDNNFLTYSNSTMYGISFLGAFRLEAF